MMLSSFVYLFAQVCVSPEIEFCVLNLLCRRSLIKLKDSSAYVNYYYPNHFEVYFYPQLGCRQRATQPIYIYIFIFIRQTSPVPLPQSTTGYQMTIFTGLALDYTFTSDACSRCQANCCFIRRWILINFFVTALLCPLISSIDVRVSIYCACDFNRLTGM